MSESNTETHESKAGGAFRRGRDVQPEMFVQIQTWKGNTGSGKIYDILQQIAANHGRRSIIVGESAADASGGKTVKTIALSVPLSGSEIADLRVNGAKILDKDQTPSDVIIAIDRSDKGRYLGRKRAAEGDAREQLAETGHNPHILKL